MNPQANPFPPDRRRIGLSWPALAGLMLLLYWSTAARAGEAVMTQTITLNPGWNAVYLELQPGDADIETALAGIPVESVWRWIPRGPLKSEFVQDPAEGLQTINGWYGYFPQPRPEAFLTNLFTLRGGQAYLIKLGGEQSVTWSITGKPQFRNQQWRSNGFSLVGFPVDPLNPPTFGDWFEPSANHAGQPLYRLSAGGYWEVIGNPHTAQIEPGSAYWVYTDGVSDYQGPMEVSLEMGDAMDFSRALTQQRIVVENHAATAVELSLTRIAEGVSALPMLFENTDPETGERAWPALRDSLSQGAEVDGGVFWKLAVNRANFSEDHMEEILAIRNGLGSRVLVHVSADTIQPLAPVVAARSTGKTTTRAVEEAVHPLAGLWVGVADVDAVSEAQVAGTQPQPVGRGFPLKVLVHVDNAGRARLLKDVIQMWRDGTYKPSTLDPEMLEVDEPGRYVLITDLDLIPAYDGATMRDGTPVGIRFSTVAYDFPEQFLPLEPELFESPGSYSVTLHMDPEYPTNPFKHKYHPDHDNLDRQFLNFSAEAQEITRTLTFQLTAKDPSGRNPPDWGDSILGGWYRETITGLHRNAIFVEGELRLKRISSVALLNQ